MVRGIIEEGMQGRREGERSRDIFSPVPGMEKAYFMGLMEEAI